MTTLGMVRDHSSTSGSRAHPRRQRSFWSPQTLFVSLIAVVTMGSYCCGFQTSSSHSPNPSFLAFTHRHPLLLGSRRISQLSLKSDGMTSEEREAKILKATKAMTGFTNSYLRNTQTKLCDQKSIPAVVIKGLAEHKVDLGAPLCPCRFYEDKEKEVKDGYWNCPCVPMREEKVCHCMLFLTEDNSYAGESQCNTQGLDPIPYAM